MSIFDPIADGISSTLDTVGQVAGNVFLQEDYRDPEHHPSNSTNQTASNTVSASTPAAENAKAIFELWKDSLPHNEDKDLDTYISQISESINNASTAEQIYNMFGGENNVSANSVYASTNNNGKVAINALLESLIPQVQFERGSMVGTPPPIASPIIPTSFIADSSTTIPRVQLNPVATETTFDVVVPDRIDNEPRASIAGDENNDGVLSRSEALARFDKNKDGIITNTEIDSSDGSGLVENTQLQGPTIGGLQVHDQNKLNVGNFVTDLSNMKATGNTNNAFYQQAEGFFNAIQRIENEAQTNGGPSVSEAVNAFGENHKVAEAFNSFGITMTPDQIAQLRQNDPSRFQTILAHAQSVQQTVPEYQRQAKFVGGGSADMDVAAYGNYINALNASLSNSSQTPARPTTTGPMDGGDFGPRPASTTTTRPVAAGTGAFDAVAYNTYANAPRPDTPAPSVSRTINADSIRPTAPSINRAPVMTVPVRNSFASPTTNSVWRTGTSTPTRSVTPPPAATTTLFKKPVTPSFLPPSTTQRTVSRPGVFRSPI